MKNIISNVKHFYDIEIIDDENIAIISPFFMLDTNDSYPINVKKIGKEYIIHDGGAIIQFINENDFTLDRTNLSDLLNEYENVKIEDDSVITYQTTKNTFDFDLAKYIQFLTKLLG